MKKNVLIAMSFAVLMFAACSSDDDSVANPLPNSGSDSFNGNAIGDFSDDITAPTVLNFGLGDNTVSATQIGDSSVDVDYFTFTVPQGQVLSAINVDNYEAADDAFIGVVVGSTFPVERTSVSPGDLLGGIIYGSSNVGTNIISDISGGGDILPANQYTVWLNQTGALSAVTLNFVITTEAASGGSDSFNGNIIGDFSDDITAPTVLNFGLGDNIVSATQIGNDSVDVDYITFTIPEGQVLSAVNVDSYDAGDPAFLAIAEGNVFPVERTTQSADNFLGGIVYGSDEVGTNIISNISGGSDVLSANQYTVWLNQTGALSAVTLNFVITTETISVDPDGIPVTSINFDESVDGDLSGDIATPTVLTFESGNNIVIASQTGGNSVDVDYITFTVPAGQVLSAINVDAFDTADRAFIAIAEGNVFPVERTTQSADDFLGGTVYGTANVGANILPSISGGTDMLPANQYTVWLNQTGGLSGVTLNFVISTP